VHEKDLTYFEAERDLLGFGHDRINAWLADHWAAPDGSGCQKVQV